MLEGHICCFLTNKLEWQSLVRTLGPERIQKKAQRYKVTATKKKRHAKTTKSHQAITKEHDAIKEVPEGTQGGMT